MIAAGDDDMHHLNALFSPVNLNETHAPKSVKSVLVVRSQTHHQAKTHEKEYTHCIPVVTIKT
jgi:hypothetical protein